MSVVVGKTLEVVRTHLKEIPYCDTVSKPDFHTSVTSHAFVAESLQERKAEIGLPPTVTTRVSGSVMVKTYTTVTADKQKRGQGDSSAGLATRTCEA